MTITNAIAPMRTASFFARQRETTDQVEVGARIECRASPDVHRPATTAATMTAGCSRDDHHGGCWRSPVINVLILRGGMRWLAALRRGGGDGSDRGRAQRSR